MKIRMIEVIALLILVASCSNGQEKIAIVPLTMLNYTDTSYLRGDAMLAKSDFFLVLNFKDNYESQVFLDNFIKQKRDVIFSDYDQYSIVFFKESKETNVKNLSEDKRVLFRYSNQHDRIYEYHWITGKFISRWKIKNGEIVDPKNEVILKPIQDSINNKIKSIN